MRHTPQAVALLLTVLFAIVDCQISLAADQPNPDKTPGVARTDISDAKICTIKWGVDARHVSDSMKAQVFASYGMSGNQDPKCIVDARGRHCEIDHLISRELGGADDIRNLWPQPYGTMPWNAQLKDKLENRLHKEACEKHSITLKQARKMIRSDWRVAYKKYYGTP